jgi:hypothetical protein
LTVSLSSQNFKEISLAVTERYLLWPMVGFLSWQEVKVFLETPLTRRYIVGVKKEAQHRKISRTS